MSVWAGLTIFCILATLPAAGEEATYVVSGGDIPVAAASNGYAQIVQPIAEGSAEVRVATTLAPIEAGGTYADVLA